MTPASPLPPPLEPPVAVPLTVLPTHDCSYLPGRAATSRGFMVRDLPAELYHDFMDAGFRRSGRLIYQPVCQACRECVPIRVPVAEFKPNKSQRRCWKRNLDLTVSVGVPVPTDENFALYSKYARNWHGKQAAEDDRESFESFLYESPVDTLEFSYRTADHTLVAVGIADVCERSFSSVYFYFDPEHADRGLGNFGALFEIDWCQNNGIKYYYLGFKICDCPAMQYKSQFKPFELLSSAGEWSRG